MNIRLEIGDLCAFAEEQGFKGYDPYDALNSPALKYLSHNSKYLRIFFIQIFKKMPVNLRPFFGIQKGLNPKGLGLFLWGYAKLYALEKRGDFLTTINYLLDLLEDSKSRGYTGNCWGYNFDWQSRAFYVPKYTPTIVNSSFIGHALIDTYRYTGNEKALAMAIPIKDFILKDLRRREEGGTICFSYTPGDHLAVHNANLLGASLLIRLFQYTGDEDLKNTALRGLAYSMKYQLDDGSWYYAETEMQKWIDSFHTGFNLQSILYFLEGGVAGEYRKAFDKGVEFYSDHFFLDDGTPKYYHDRIYPIDIHSASQALVFFSQMGDHYRPLSNKIVEWMITHLQDKEGHFYFQKHRYYTNKIPYIRWAQAWSFHALTEYYLNEKQT